jgi:hypothetical protein
MTEPWYTDAEYVVDISPDTDTFSQYASHVYYDEDHLILRLSTRLTATTYDSAAIEATDWLAHVRHHLNATGHPGTPIRHTIQNQTALHRSYAAGTAEAAKALGVNPSPIRPTHEPS